jgi:hypothetical protein
MALRSFDHVRTVRSTQTSSRQVAAALLASALALWGSGCGEGPGDLGPPDGVEGELPACIEGSTFDCEGTFHASPAAKEDSPERAGVQLATDTRRTDVWTVKNQWEDTTTTAARAAGPAWGADSGLTWDQKFSTWLEAMQKIDGAEGHKTFRLLTPDGRTFEAPVLECADTAIFLRVIFASWYRLPFFLQATDGKGVTSYMGHFGWRTRTGRYPGAPEFAVAYSDYSSRSAADLAARGWPHDSRLRAKTVYPGEDYSDILKQPGAVGGTYFDEVLLNKRVGHLLVLILKYFGSINLADPSNTYDMHPEALRTGDFLIERWQKTGIGHTLVAKHVARRDDGKLVVELISGTMPPRQALWEDQIASKRYFGEPEFGGPGTNYDGDDYARLGGGLKRWRVARVRNGAWINGVMNSDGSLVIPFDNYDAISARPAAYADLIADVSPEELRDGLLDIINGARTYLQDKPASCSARTKREEAFRDLYAVMYDNFYMYQDEVDQQYRILDDYVLAELVYTQSKTCCWDTTSRATYDVVMAAARDELADSSTGTCKAPTVFRWQSDGYGFWKAAAARHGQSWKDWSEDEPCTQRGVAEDLVADSSAVAYCELPGGL